MAAASRRIGTIVVMVVVVVVVLFVVDRRCRGGVVVKVQSRIHKGNVAVPVTGKGGPCFPGATMTYNITSTSQNTLRDVELGPVQESRKVLRCPDAPCQHGRGQGPAQEFLP